MRAISTLVLTVILGPGLSLWALQCGGSNQQPPSPTKVSPKTQRVKLRHRKTSGGTLGVLGCIVGPAQPPREPVPAPRLPPELFVFSAPPPVLAQPPQK